MITKHIISGAMTFIMSIIAMIRLMINMRKKLTNDTLFSAPTYCDAPIIKGQDNNSQKLPAPPVCEAEYYSMMKRMGELEGKVTALSAKQPAVPPKDEKLTLALSRVDSLQQDLIATRKVYTYEKIYLQSITRK